MLRKILGKLAKQDLYLALGKWVGNFVLLAMTNAADNVTDLSK